MDQANFYHCASRCKDPEYAWDLAINLVKVNFSHADDIALREMRLYQIGEQLQQLGGQEMVEAATQLCDAIAPT